MAIKVQLNMVFKFCACCLQSYGADQYFLVLKHGIPSKKRYIKGKNVKGKAIPLQALTGPEGSRRLRLPDFKTIST
jgi:hypothetical protein